MRADDLRRNRRTKNLVVAVLLVVMAVAFFALTIVRMGQQARPALPDAANDVRRP